MKVLTYHQHSDITSYLVSRDERLHDLFKLKDEIKVHINDRYYEALVDAIIAQQLSSKVAFVISNRVYEFLKQDVTPEHILSTSDEGLRQCGLSYQKISYLKSLAQCISEGKVSFDGIDQKTDQEVIDMLIQVKGIGVWTAQMFLIFSLGREDVFSVGDLGLRNAVKKIYQNPELSHQDIEKIAERWSPYRSVVSHFLWHAWDFE